MNTDVLLSCVGLLAAIAVLMILSYKGWSILIYSAIATLIVCLFCGMDLWDGLVNGWAAGTGDYVGTWLLLFLGGAIFGQIYERTGAAAAIANALGKVFGEKIPSSPSFLPPSC